MAVISISGLNSNFGAQTAPFNVSFTVNTDETGVTGIAVNLYVNGANMYHTDTGTQGQQINVEIDTRVIGAGNYEILVEASKSGYTTGTATSAFTISSLVLPDGGKAIQLQDDLGNALYPQSVAGAIQGLYGESVGGNLTKLVKALLWNQQQGNITDYSGNVIDLVEKFGLVTDENISTIPGITKIQTGSYTGTGTYGASNPCSLTFVKFARKIKQIFVIIATNLCFKKGEIEYALQMG